MGKITPLFGGEAGEPKQEEGGPVQSDLIGGMTGQLVAAQNQVAESQKGERRLAKQAEVAARATSEWKQRAMAAVRAGDDVVARDALLRKRQLELECERLRAAGKEQQLQTAALTRAFVTLHFRVDEVEHGAAEPVGRRADEMLNRLEAKMTAIETELELSGEAIANLALEARDALRSQGKLTRLKREASDSALFASKPLARTAPNDAAGARSSTPQAVVLSPPRRKTR